MRGPRRTMKLLLVLGVAAMLGGCASAATSAPTPSVPPSPTAEAAARSAVTLVRGTSQCVITSHAEATQDGIDVVTEHFYCVYQMSDRRLDGEVEADFITTIEPSGAAAGRWEGTVTITNSGGSWTGPAKGSLVFWPGANAPYNYGEGTYEGSGEYVGLTYHELVAGGDSATTVSGWIEPTK